MQSSVPKMLFRTMFRMLTVLTMLTMIYLFENNSSDREQGINHSSIEEWVRRLALFSGDPWSPSASKRAVKLTPCRVKHAYRTSHHCATRATLAVRHLTAVAKGVCGF